MLRSAILIVGITLTGTACQHDHPAPWDGPVLTEPRTQLTVRQLTAGDSLPLLDMSFFARPEWAKDSAVPLSGSVSFGESDMTVSTGWSSEGGDLFPALTVEFISHEQKLIPRFRE